MVSSTATTVGDYLAALPPERRKVVRSVRSFIRKHIPPGYRESMGFGMITYQVPHSRYPDTYNKQPLMYVALAAQKHNYSLYLTCAYMDEARARRLREAFRRAGKRIDMGKSCIRFMSLDDLDLDAIAAEIASTPPDQFIARHEMARR
jgi:uncharacterized protein YdhG (YjbR/CyaY superfamily)